MVILSGLDYCNRHQYHSFQFISDPVLASKVVNVTVKVAITLFLFLFIWLALVQFYKGVFYIEEKIIFAAFLFAHGIVQKLRRRLRKDWWKTKLCTACVSPLGRFLSRGGTCPQCGLRVCKNCRSESPSGLWVCVLCSSGEMPSDDVAKTTKSLGRDSRSIRRSWTISNPQRAQTNSPILKSYTVLYPEDGGAVTDGGNDNGESGIQCSSSSTGHISNFGDCKNASSSSRNKSLIFGGSDQGLNSSSLKNSKTTNILRPYHNRNIDEIIRQRKNRVGGGTEDANVDENNPVKLRQFHSLPRMSTSVPGCLSVFAPSSSSPSNTTRGPVQASKTGKRSFNSEVQKENIKRHRSFQTTLHPYNPAQANHNPPSPAASVNFIEETFWDYYDYEYENSSSDPGSTPRNLRRTVTAAAISENSSALSSRRGRYTRENSNRSSCERSLGETMDYDCSLRMNQFSISDTEINETGKRQDEKLGTNNIKAYPTMSSSDYRRRNTGNNDELNAHPRSSYHYPTISSSINPYLPPSEYVYRRRHHDHDMFPNEAPPKPERKSRNNKRSVSLNAYDGRKLFSPLRTYCVLMKENIQPGDKPANELGQNDPSSTHRDSSFKPLPSSSDNSRNTTSAILNNTSPISLSFTTTSTSSPKFNSLPRERYIKIEREDGDGATSATTANKFSSLKYPKKTDMHLLGKADGGSRGKNVSRVPINNEESNGESGFSIHRNAFAFTPPKSKIERSQSYREISSNRPYNHSNNISTSAANFQTNQQPRHHYYHPPSGSDKASTTAVDLNFMPHAGTAATLPKFGKARDAGKLGNANNSGSRNFFQSEFDDGSDVVIENFIKTHGGSGNSPVNTFSNTLPKRKYPPSTTHISNTPIPPHHQQQQRRVSDGNNEPRNTSIKPSADIFQQVDSSRNNHYQCSTFPRGARTKKDASAADTLSQNQTEILPNIHQKNTLSNQRDNSPSSNQTLPKIYYQPEKHDNLFPSSNANSLSLPHSSNNLFEVPKQQQQQTERIVPIKSGSMLTGPGSSATLPHPYIRRNKQLSINSQMNEKNNDNNKQQLQQQRKEDGTVGAFQTKDVSGPSISEIEMEIERDIFYQKTRSLDRVRPSSKSKLKSVLSLVRRNHGSPNDNENPSASTNLHHPMEIDYSDSQPYNNTGRFSSENIFSKDQLDRSYANGRNNGSGKSTHVVATNSTNDLLQPQQIHHSKSNTVSNSASPPPPVLPIPSPRLKRKAKLQQNESNPAASSSSTSLPSSSFSQQNANNTILCSPKINGNEMSSSTSSKLIGPGTNYGSQKQASFSFSNNSTASATHLLNEPDRNSQPQQEHYQKRNNNEALSSSFHSKTNASSTANPILPETVLANSSNSISNNSSGPSTKFNFVKDTAIKTDHLPSPTTVFNNNSVDGLMNSEKSMGVLNSNSSQPSTSLMGSSNTANYSNSNSPGVNFMISKPSFTQSLSSLPSTSVGDFSLQNEQFLSSSKGKTPATEEMRTTTSLIDSPQQPHQIKSALANSSGAESFGSKLANNNGNLPKAVRFEPHVIAMEIESEQRKLLQQQQQQQMNQQSNSGSVTTHNHNGGGINSMDDGGVSIGNSNNNSSMKSNSGHQHNMQRHVYGNKGRHHHYGQSSSTSLPVLYHSYHNQQHKYVRKGTNLIAGGGASGGLKTGKKSKKHKGFVARAIAKVKSKAANIKKDSSSSTSAASPTVYYPVQQGNSKGVSMQQQHNTSANNLPPTPSSPSLITYISPQPQQQHSQPPAQHSLDEVSTLQQLNIPTITVSLTSTSSEETGGKNLSSSNNPSIVNNNNGQSKKYVIPGSGKLKKGVQGKSHQQHIKGIVSGQNFVGVGGSVPRRMDSYLDPITTRVIGDDNSSGDNQFSESFSLHADRFTPSSTSSSSSSFTSNLQESYDLYHNQNLPDSVHELVVNATIAASATPSDSKPDKTRREIEENFDSLNEDEDSSNNANEADDDRHFAFKSFDESDFEEEEPDFVFYRANPNDSSIPPPPPATNISSGSVRPQQHHHYSHNSIDKERNKVIKSAATSSSSSVGNESNSPFPSSSNNDNNNETTTKGNNINKCATVTTTPAQNSDSKRDSDGNSSMRNKGKSTSEPKMVVGIPTYRSPNTRRLIYSPKPYGKSQNTIPSPNNANPMISLPKSINENVTQKSAPKEPHPSLHPEGFYSSISSPKENVRGDCIMGASSSFSSPGFGMHHIKDSLVSATSDPSHDLQRNNRHSPIENLSGSRASLQERMKGLSQHYEKQQQRLHTTTTPSSHQHIFKAVEEGENVTKQQQQNRKNGDQVNEKPLHILKGEKSPSFRDNKKNINNSEAGTHYNMYNATERNADYAQDTFPIMQKGNDNDDSNIPVNKNIASYEENGDDESCKERVATFKDEGMTSTASPSTTRNSTGHSIIPSSTSSSPSSNSTNLSQSKDRLSDLTTSSTNSSSNDNATITKSSRRQEQLGALKNVDEIFKGEVLRRDVFGNGSSSGNSEGVVTTNTVNSEYVNKDAHPSYNVSTLASNSVDRDNKLFNPSVKNNLQEVEQHEPDSSSSSILQARISSNLSNNANRKNQSTVTNNGNENLKDVERLRRLELVKKKQNLFKSQSQTANFNFPINKAKNSFAGSKIIKPEQEENNEVSEGRETPNRAEAYFNSIEQPNSLETHCANDQSVLSESEVSSSGKSPSPSPRFRCKKPGNRQSGGNRVHAKIYQQKQNRPTNTASSGEEDSPGHSQQQNHHLLNTQQQQTQQETQGRRGSSPLSPEYSAPTGMSILPSSHQQYLPIQAGATSATSLSGNDNVSSGTPTNGKFKSRVLLNSDDLEDDEELSRAVASALNTSGSSSKVASGSSSNNNKNVSVGATVGKKNITTVEISGDVGIVSSNGTVGVESNVAGSSFHNENFSKNSKIIGRKLSNEHLQSSGLSLIQQPHLLDLYSDNESLIDDPSSIGIANEKPIEPEIKANLLNKVVRRSLSEEVGSSVSANESSGGDTEKTSDDNSSDWQSESTNTVIFRGGSSVIDSEHHPFFASPTNYADPEIQINNITVVGDDENFLPVEEGGSGTTSKVNVGHKATKVNKVSSDLIIGLKKSTTDKISSSPSVSTGEENIKIGSKRKFDKNNDVSSSSSSSAADSSEELGKSNETLTDIPVTEGNQSDQVVSQFPQILEEQDTLEVEMVIHADNKIVNGGNRVFVQGNNTNKSSPNHRRESPEGQEQEVPDRSEDNTKTPKTTTPSSEKDHQISHQQLVPVSAVPNANQTKMERYGDEGNGHDSGAGSTGADVPNTSEGKAKKKSLSSRGTINKEKILQTMLSQIPSRSSPDGADKSDATPEPDVESPTPAGVVDAFDVTSDEDSWVEEILFEDEDDTSFEEAVKKLPPPLDLTLHTIVEESCEESEAENSGNFYQPSTSGLGGSQKNPSLSQSESNANELEKYFNFGIYPDGNAGGKNVNTHEESEFSDTFSESSFSLQEDDFDNGTQEGLLDPAELASTRLEKYFYNLGGPPSMMNSMANTISQNADSDSVGSESDSDNSVLEKRKKVLKHHRRSADFDEEFGDKVSDEEENFGFGQDGFDTIKKTARKTKNKSGSEGSGNDSHHASSIQANQSGTASDNADTTAELSSSIFETLSPKSLKKFTPVESSQTKKSALHSSGNEKPVIKVNRSNSFTWSSDEEVNIMMSKLRQIIKNLIKSKAEAGNSNSATAQSSATSSATSTTSETGSKDKQLVYLENELIRLMKTDNLKNIVEYLSSEESDVDDVYKFIKVVNSSGSTPVDLDDLGDLGDLDIDDPNLLENLQSTMQFQQDGTGPGGTGASPKSSPALLAKVMHHIGNRLNMWMKDEANLEDDTNDDNVTLKCAPSVSSDLNEDRFSWKGSFESALAAKRQSVGSTDSISSSDYGQDKSMLRSSSLHHLTTSQPIEENKEEEQPTSSLPRMTNLCNSLPRLNNQPNNQAISRAHSLVMTGKNEQHHQQPGTETYPVSISGPVKSARYRPPGFQPSIKAKRIETEEKTSPAILSQSTPVLSQDPATLKNRSDSMGSIFNDVKPLISVKGQVEFGLQYNYKLACLEVKVAGCRDLAAADPKRHRSDPYVKAYLLPDKSKAGKRKTKTKKNTLNPVFDEILKFPLTLSDLQNRTLWLSVWHSDMFGKNEFLGEILVSLKDRVFDDPNPGWWDLQEMSGQVEDMPKGDAVIALKWQPKTENTGNLSVLVKEAKNLVPVKNGSPSTFVKCALLSDKTRKQKTSICRRNFNPIWNQTLFFEDVDDDGIEITVWNHDLLASHDLIGTVRLEYDNHLWESMISRPSFWVEGGLKLS